jgi:hypothetical protein
LKKEEPPTTTGALVAASLDLPKLWLGPPLSLVQLSWCENDGVDFVFGLARNQRLRGMTVMVGFEPIIA